mmetsp:Transcript_16576/g.36665  ORF Transcript_16576/g.36665 Transcript_16576/m.36665 type:complete len:302 (+) Transcript_16576:51-956(+)|eukprot:CAMPEP_0204386166 /NCGR_PEP_ID=MMETSP0469-20131031/58207_1 /ASSEMBLY_ACC=CAM_ASM_000384 /TAXON_ID=2969 /ORGANISM="Oxyrrhis marina" /LENGTH=301 /DNA_ID=CAMNT_0051379333 /DNA_START=46 /DNA_END=951 /DNA_ORIENTATION=-
MRILFLPTCVAALRGFMNTPEGQIHYRVWGDMLENATALVMFHGNPRSTAEFERFAPLLCHNHPVVSFDFYGQGNSDDCRSCGDNGTVALDVFAGYVGHELGLLGVRRFVPVGQASGTGVAVALAVQNPRSVSHLVLGNPIWYFPEVEKHVATYMAMTQHPALVANGSHVLEAWTNFNMNGHVPAGTDEPSMELTESKTLDRLRAFWTQHWYMRAYLQHNARMLDSLRQVEVPVLVLYASEFFAVYDAAGMNATQQRPVLLDAISHKVETVIPDSFEGFFWANASYVAPMVSRFLGDSQFI